MSISVRLHFSKALDLELLEKNIEVWLRRLTVQVSFKTPRAWTQPYEAIMDTGAPVSIIPPAIWKDIDREILGEYKIQGIVLKRDAFLPVKIANISCVLMDEKNVTEPCVCGKTSKGKGLCRPGKGDASLTDVIFREGVTKKQNKYSLQLILNQWISLHATSSEALCALIKRLMKCPLSSTRPMWRT